MDFNKITIRGAREFNLKNVDVTIPKNQLVVFSGVSGSGKSSLAFKTIYAEGRRRYIESLSSYARQFLGGTEKPDVDTITGLSPTIAIDQKTTSHNPRSTVGTVTEIYDYLRLLYARVGKPYCPNKHGEIKAVTIKEIIHHIQKKAQAERIMVLAPVIVDRKGQHHELLTNIKKDNFIRVRIDKTIYRLDSDITLKAQQRHNIDIVIDRIELNNNPTTTSRLHDSLEIALKYGNNLARVVYLEQNEHEDLFSSTYACAQCNFTVPHLEPRLFSFNAPLGACASCRGLGVTLEVDPNLLIPDPRLSIEQGAIKYLRNAMVSANFDWQKFQALLNYYAIPVNKAYNLLSRQEQHYILYGSDTKITYKIASASIMSTKHDYLEGVAVLIKRRYAETTSTRAREYYASYLQAQQCLTCAGARLNKEALAVKVNQLDIFTFTTLAIEDALVFMRQLPKTLSTNDQQIARLIMSEITNRLTFLHEVGLTYLTLARMAKTLSGGEAQRIRLATQIGSQLAGVIYVLDEPSIGLHQKDNHLLIQTLRNLRDLGNTLIVVEHDDDTVLAADWIVDIGPKAGVHGGEIIVNGTLQDLLVTKDSVTAAYLNETKTIPVPTSRMGGNGKKIVIYKAQANNLQKINVTFPLQKLIVVTGVSGSGKSSLVNEVLYQSLKASLHYKTPHYVACEKIKGLEHIDKVIHISQDPIGKTPRSNPATYTSVFDDIRDLFATTPLAKAKGYLKGRFSFNVPGGRCAKCEGDGIIKISMQFLPTVYITCEVCHGKRYNDETLLVRFKNKNIYDVLNMTVAEALVFFANQPKIKQKLTTIIAVGLDYIKLGQPATSLSGGESQRVKLSTYLLKKPTGKTLYLLDEPTTGLHNDDVRKLLVVLQQLVTKGETVVVIEHNLHVIKTADYIIDLGPDGGKYGGCVVAHGTPEQVVKQDGSYTAHYLQGYLKK